MSRVAAETRSKALALMERVLRDGAPLAGEYPLVFRDEFPGRVLALEEGGAVVSSCAVLVRDFVVGTSSVRVGLIGSVVTAPECRGRGLASRLLAHAEDELAREGCVFAMLWADDPNFYDARGWRPIGAEVDFTIEPWQEGRLCGASGIRSAAPDDFSALHRLYSLHHERVDRSRAESLALLSGPGIETLVLQRSRDVVAYTCLGRGKDFARTIHEWAGSDADVLALVRAHMQRAQRRGEHGPTYMLTPSNARALHDRLRGCGVAWSDGVLAQGKLLDLQGAAQLLAQFIGPEVAVGVENEIQAGTSSPRITLEGPRGRSSLSNEDLLDILVPARGRRTRIEELERALAVQLPALPLALFAWGLDSI